MGPANVLFPALWGKAEEQLRKIDEAGKRAKKTVKSPRSIFTGKEKIDKTRKEDGETRQNVQ